MRLGIMQPYFFPNLAHFGLIAATDRWVVFDVTQYTKKTWISRNRILHPTDGWQYLSVPLANGSIHIRIHEARLADPAAFHQSVRGKLGHYRKTAPYFDAVLALVDRTFDTAADDTLVALNTAGLAQVCAYLGLPFDPVICSAMELEFPAGMGPGDWAPFICHAMGASEYLNPPGGRDLFDPARFEAGGTTLYFGDFAPFDYDTPGYGFVEHLSILDVLMWNAPGDVARAARDNMTLIAARDG